MIIIKRQILYCTFLFIANSTICSSAVQTTEKTELLQEALQVDAAYIHMVESAISAYVMIAGGSGVIISADGLMLTNHHVIAPFWIKGEHRFTVRNGANWLYAQLLGTDPYGDLALLQIETKERLSYLDFADSDALVVGQQVMALGNPFATMEGGRGEPAVTFGVISCLHRFQDGYSDAILTDTPINPGNSGGPLLTMTGRLAGINGRISSSHGGRANTGIALAIPANQIVRFIPALKTQQGGIVRHGFIRGLLSDNRVEELQNGSTIKLVTPDSKAAKAGLKDGDRIIRIDGHPILNHARLRGVIGTYPPSTELDVVVFREGREMVLKIVLEPLDPGELGIVYRNLAGDGDWQAAYRRLLHNDQRSEPLIVETLLPNYPAAESGLQPGDEIISIEGKSALNPLDYTKSINALKAAGAFWAGERLRFKVLRRTSKRETVKLEFEVEVGSSYTSLLDKAFRRERSEQNTR